MIGTSQLEMLFPRKSTETTSGWAKSITKSHNIWLLHVSHQDPRSLSPGRPRAQKSTTHTSTLSGRMSQPLDAKPRRLTEALTLPSPLERSAKYWLVEVSEGL